jgi:hypothetical protein
LLFKLLRGVMAAGRNLWHGHVNGIHRLDCGAVSPAQACAACLVPHSRTCKQVCQYSEGDCWNWVSEPRECQLGVANPIHFHITYSMRAPIYVAGCQTCSASCEVDVLNPLSCLLTASALMRVQKSVMLALLTAATAYMYVRLYICVPPYLFQLYLQRSFCERGYYKVKVESEISDHKHRMQGGVAFYPLVAVNLHNKSRLQADKVPCAAAAGGGACPGSSPGLFQFHTSV